MCFSTEDYNEWINSHYHKNYDSDDDEKIVPKWFLLLYCDECKKYIEFTKIKCSQYQSYRLIVTCSFCQNN